MSRGILVINGPNLNLLGQREPALYGNQSLGEINQELERMASASGIGIEFFQSNHEGELVDRIQQARDDFELIIINAGALSHYSISLHDALRAVNIPVIEVHLSNIYTREEFRHKSLISPVAVGGIFGFGALSYRLAFLAACEIIKGREA
ncbi:MAG: type II 3-dehydroquinate dehydratase [Syntrophomonadaceae bacterium]|nr:type II 3-dehydroquinate dehydratase [Syntrophomonadaceae bacterium]MDD3271547.1 type II 3-dehydroquinate dehydratase [Syntrophomonadaceae bacterium]MDD4562657.1 type II 3-dehydroquinate dehydratase [Syntrophomonadaceae bacterium]